MAISPQSLNSDLIEECRTIEANIDKQLASKHQNKGSYVIVYPPRLMTSNHFKILKQWYLEAGWKDVKDQFDPKEHDSWLEFYFPD